MAKATPDAVLDKMLDEIATARSSTLPLAPSRSTTTA